jgi:ABC-type multidrug transport system fused ATPase/permease subunit
MRYRPNTPEVLRGLSAVLPGGSRIGVCGRTGAGKSSLIAALFRTADEQSGSILIDGLDTAAMPLHSLRSSLALVPQDAALFRGSLRRNLDVLGGSSDEQLWAALEAVGLRAAVSSLEAQVAEGGANFSAGERQLISIARAFLRQAKIVVLDEATANVDSSGDALVQAAFKSAFRGATVITVAHRLATILDSDLILVLKEGVIAEMGPPQALLQDAASLFSGLVQESARAGAKGGGH